MLRLAIPSDGALYEPALLFLRSCGLGVTRTSLRSYVAEVPGLPGATVHFQRASDIALKVEDGSADIGIVGHDRFLESKQEDGASSIMIDNLGFGHSDLAIGVPDSWVDVTSMADVADLSMEFREEGKDLRVATKYPRSVERFLLANGVNYFSLVPSSGTLEAAPAMGYADIIADISSTGVTMRENRLKTVHGGSVMSSEACLIGNQEQIASDPEKLARAQTLVQRIEAYLQSL